MTGIEVDIPASVQPRGRLRISYYTQRLSHRPMTTSRIVLTGTDISTIGDNDGATTEEGELSWNGASVWYSWTAPADGRVTLAIPETLLRTSFGVFTGEVVSELTHVTNNGLGGGRDPSIDFVACACRLHWKLPD